MALHKNARTCPNSRLEMARRVFDERRPVRQVAREFGVTPKTVYKWLRRYKETPCGAGLEDASSAPKTLPHKLGEDKVAEIVRLRRERRWTARVIGIELGIPRSTVSAVLKREGISRLKSLDPKEPVVLYEHPSPGALLHMDVKKLGRFRRPGHRVEGRGGKASRGAGVECVHVCIDDHSRVAYVEIHPDERAETAVGFLRRAVEWYRQQGVSVERVLTDNGGCYRSGRWQRTCAELDVKPKKTRPYRPQTNGKAERFIQTLLREWAYGRVYQNSDERGAALRPYVSHYNWHRGHGSLNYQPPITRLPGVENLHGTYS